MNICHQFVKNFKDDIVSKDIHSDLQDTLAEVFETGQLTFTINSLMQEIDQLRARKSIEDRIWVVCHTMNLRILSVKIHEHRPDQFTITFRPVQ